MMYVEEALSLLLASSLGPLTSYSRILENSSPAIFRELLQTLKLSQKNVVVFLGGNS